MTLTQSRYPTSNWIEVFIYFLSYIYVYIYLYTYILKRVSQIGTTMRQIKCANLVSQIERTVPRGNFHTSLFSLMEILTPYIDHLLVSKTYLSCYAYFSKFYFSPSQILKKAICNFLLIIHLHAFFFPLSKYSLLVNCIQSSFTFK